MGYDVTYHPISEEEIEEWYFGVLDNRKKRDGVARKYIQDDFYREKYENTVAAGARVGGDEVFDTTHGFYIAIVQGFFRKFFYTRGAAFSFLIDRNDYFKRYTKSWRDLVRKKITNPVNNAITENYCSGVYIPFEKAVLLLEDYNNNDTITNALNNYYSENRIEVFLRALLYAKENKVGLLEASDAIEPFPRDLNNSAGYTNFWNCDSEGLLLYQQAVVGELLEFRKSIPKK